MRGTIKKIYVSETREDNITNASYIYKIEFEREQFNKKLQVTIKSDNDEHWTVGDQAELSVLARDKKNP